jgi:hypothetical protein
MTVPARLADWHEGCSSRVTDFPRVLKLFEQAIILKELSMRLNSIASTAAIALAVAGLAGLSGVAQAESNLGSNSASASLDFQVVIPGIVFLQVGTGTFREDVDTVNQIVFDLDAAELLAGDPVAATSGSDAPNPPGTVSVRVWGNIGELQLSSTATELSDGVGNSIPWSELTVLASGNGGNPNFVPHNAFDTDGAMSVLLTPPGNSGVVNRQGTWAYTYANATEPSAGTYDGTVTYTVANP